MTENRVTRRVPAWLRLLDLLIPSLPAHAQELCKGSRHADAYHQYGSADNELDGDLLKAGQ